MERVILHSDLTNFYASVEALHHPELRDKPLAVGGDVSQRHGIILAKNQLAKRYGIQTGEALWQARRKCPSLIIMPPNFTLYQRFSQLAREIYLDYTDQVEPFGIDECWLDVTGSLRGSGPEIADEIRRRIKRELGVTVSIGVSYNKIFAKLGSDYKKPDGLTVIGRDDYQSTVWPLPASVLLYVGRSTQAKLHRYGYESIGDVAKESPKRLRELLGKWGEVLWIFANGKDQTPVAKYDARTVIKSVGNSTTTPRDLEDEEDVKMVITVLAESVAERMREQGFRAKTVAIHVRDTDLYSFERQGPLPTPSCLASEIIGKAMELFRRNYRWEKPIRSIGVRGADLVPDDYTVQTDLMGDEIRRARRERMEAAMDTVRRRFGHFSIQRAISLQDRRLTALDPKQDHTIHPYSYF